MRLALAFALAAIPGCIEVGAFACLPGACDLDGRDGVCEPQGWCSYPDGDCDSGRRFESRAPGDLGGACVPVADGSTGLIATSTSSGATLETASTTEDPSNGSSETTESSSSTGPDIPACDGHGCGWTRVESGAFHTCAVDGNGAVWCWGVGAAGELGTGSNASFRDCPSAPAGDLVDQMDIAVGGHTCALGEGGLHCWGPNIERQVDWMAPQLQFLEPHLVPFTQKQTVSSVGVGEGRTCVGLANTLVCWGDGETEVDTTIAPASVDVVEIGDDHICGLLGDGTLYCLGSDARGQLGGGPPDQTDMPISPNMGGEVALAIAVGGNHTCAITDGDGPEARNVKCWGDNRANQAGGVVENQIDAPRDVSGNLVSGAWIDVAAGGLHSCVINQEGEVWCWGTNEFGQVDPNNKSDGALTSDRIELDPAVDAVDIAVATTITCALDRDARWWCWGCLEPWMGDSCTVSPPTLFEPC